MYCGLGLKDLDCSLFERGFEMLELTLKASEVVRMVV